MENKLIMSEFNILDYEPHENFKMVRIVDEKANFPISWLNTQGYCEYSLFLEYYEGISTAPTKEMTEGTRGHALLEEKFKETAQPSTFEDAFDLSKEEEILSREMFVIDIENGIRGYIDEIRMTPEKIIIIDDKPGNIPYPSTINQVRAYCLAFKSMVGEDNRKIIAALRERGTGNIFWHEEFDENNEQRIRYQINSLHRLIDNKRDAIPTKNPNKCKKCRFQSYCEEKAI